jgi:hypothetical protein
MIRLNVPSPRRSELLVDFDLLHGALKAKLERAGLYSLKSVLKKCCVALRRLPPAETAPS